MASENIHCITSKQFVTILKKFDKDGKIFTNGAKLLVEHLHVSASFNILPVYLYLLTFPRTLI